MKIKQFSIELSDEAEVDFDKSYEFYYQDSTKVANAFFRRINLDIENIKESPILFSGYLPDLFPGQQMPRWPYWRAKFL